MLRKTLRLLAVVWLSCVAALSALYLSASATTSVIFVQDLTKALLQLATVAVLASVVSLVTAQFNRDRLERDQRRDEAQRLRENRDEFHKDLLTRIHRAHASAKRSKRLLRARAFNPPFYPNQNPASMVLAAVYDEHMQVINDVQLDLEMLAKEVLANTTAFLDSDRILSAVEAMEKRLKELVAEYERKRGAFSGEPATASISELATLADFASPGTQSRLAQAFTNAYADAVRALLIEILGASEEPRTDEANQGEAVHPSK